MITRNYFIPTDWKFFFIIVFLASIVRLVFFNGFLGSDDLTYLNRSSEISQGIWTSANYNGALRYGFNIPAGFFIWLFGLNTFAANFWPFLCSLGEIALVYFFTTRFINKQAGVYAAIVLALTPLHVAAATRIHADPVLAFFVTLSFVLLFVSQNTKSARLFFSTGLSLGMIFWVKELAAVIYVAFLTYPILLRRFEFGWTWIVFGGCIMLILHFLLMQLIAGNPFHLIETVAGQVQTSFIDGGAGEDSVGYYFKYLFLEIKHTWLLAYLFLAGLFLVCSPGSRYHDDSSVTVKGLERPSVFVAWWAVILLVVLSFFPVSLTPVRFVMKQSNYLNLFFAPLAILSGYFLSRIETNLIRLSLLLITLTGSFVLGSMEQAVYRVFTSNSKAAVQFALEHPDEWFLGSRNNSKIAGIYSILNSDQRLSKRFGSLSYDVDTLLGKYTEIDRNTIGYIIVDNETDDWGGKSVDLQQTPSCWKRVQSLEPIGFGISTFFLYDSASVLKKMLPKKIVPWIYSRLDQLLMPQEATIYRANISNLWCDKTYFPTSYVSRLESRSTSIER